MSATQFPVIYSQATGRIRYYYRLDSDKELESMHLGKGEAMLVLPMKQFGNHLELQELVNAETQLTPTDDRYAIVDAQGNVTGAILADPACDDAVSGHELIAHPEANKGWTVTKDAQNKPVFTKPPEIPPDPHIISPDVISNG